MASWKYADDSNLGEVTLGSAYTSGSGTMSLTAGHGARLPSSGDFWLGYDTGSGIRIFKVTARSTDTLTVTADATEGIGDGSISSGQTLKPVVSNAAVDQLKADIIATSGLVLLEVEVASASSSLNFTNISSDYESYYFLFQEILLGTDSAQMRARVSTDGGSSWDSSAIYQWMYFLSSGTGTAVSGATTNTSFQLGAGNESTANQFTVNANFILSNPGSGNYKAFYGDYTTMDSSGTGIANMYWTKCHCYWKSTTAVNGIQFFPSSGTITSGKIFMFGFKKAL